jgi:serine/threonine protein kinase
MKPLLFSSLLLVTESEDPFYCCLFMSTLYLFRQLVSAVDYMHLNGICHRDLKLENLLLDENNDIKIIDLGLGNFYNRQKLLDSFCGTADYASPELWQGKRYTGPEVDIWSMGVLLFVFLTGKMPFLSPRHAVMGDFFFPPSPQVSESKFYLFSLFHHPLPSFVPSITFYSATLNANFSSASKAPNH